MMKHPARTSMTRVVSAPRAAQRGISLLFALMALVILGFGAVALTRSVDTGTLIMGNLAFRQDAMTSSNKGSEAAFTWLATNVKPADYLNSDRADFGYSAASIDSLDPFATRTSAANKLAIVDWDGKCMGLASTAYAKCVKPYTGTDVNGNTVKWLITRLCLNSGTPSSPNVCSRPPTTASSTASDRGELSGGRISGGVASPYYRVIVRVEGVRNTVTMTESMIHF
jgi:type IV pilus assembly protein PilX